MGTWSFGRKLSAALLLCATWAQAADIRWTNASGGDFQTPGNWEGGIVPGETDKAVFDLTATYTVTWSGAVTNDRMLVENGPVTWDLQGHIYTLGNNIERSSVGTHFTPADLTITNGTVKSVTIGNSKWFTLDGEGTTLRLLANAKVLNALTPNFVEGQTHHLIIDGANAEFENWGTFIDFYAEVVATNGGVLTDVHGLWPRNVSALRLSGPGLSWVTLKKMDANVNVRCDNGATVTCGTTDSGSHFWGTLTLEGNARYKYTYGAAGIDKQVYLKPGAVLQGRGTLAFPGVQSTGGFIRPGGTNAAGHLTVTGVLSNGDPAGTIEIELGGTETNQYDRLVIKTGGDWDETWIGTLSAGGTLNVTLIDGFQPQKNNSFDILDYVSMVGTFATVNLPGGASVWNTANLSSNGVITYLGKTAGGVFVVR